MIDINDEFLDRVRHFLSYATVSGSYVAHKPYFLVKDRFQLTEYEAETVLRLLKAEGRIKCARQSEARQRHDDEHWQYRQRQAA